MCITQDIVRFQLSTSIILSNYGSVQTVNGKPLRCLLSLKSSHTTFGVDFGLTGAYICRLTLMRLLEMREEAWPTIK